MECLSVRFYSSPGFNEVFDLFAGPLAVVEVLEDGVVARRTGQLTVLPTKKLSLSFNSSLHAISQSPGSSAMHEIMHNTAQEFHNNSFS